MRLRHAIYVVIGAGACASPKPASDTIAATDTMTPAVVASPATAGTSPATPATGATTTVSSQTAKTTTKASTTKTRAHSPRTARDTAHLGRDSVIRINPRDPKRQIPVVKKP